MNNLLEKKRNSYIEIHLLHQMKHACCWKYHTKILFQSFNFPFKKIMLIIILIYKNCYSKIFIWAIFFILLSFKGWCILTFTVYSISDVIHYLMQSEMFIFYLNFLLIYHIPFVKLSLSLKIQAKTVTYQLKIRNYICQLQENGSKLMTHYNIKWN